MTPSSFAALRTHQIARSMGVPFTTTTTEPRALSKPQTTYEVRREIERLHREQLLHPERSAKIRARRAVLRDLLHQQLDAEHQELTRQSQAIPEICTFAPLLDPTPHRRHSHPEESGGVTGRDVLLVVVLVALLTALALQYFGVLLP
jgi:hypothetical protein